MLNFLFSSTPLKFLVQDIWRDEAFSYLLAKKNVIDIVTLSARDFNPPLHTLLLHFWIKIFGASEVSLRLLSFLFFWATLYVVYLFLKNIFKFSFAKCAFFLLFFLINPMLVYYAFEARAYMLFAFFATSSFYFFYRKQFKAHLITSVLGLYTHYFMIFVVLGQLIFSWLTDRQEEEERKKLITTGLRILLFFLPWIVIVGILKRPLFNSFWIDKTNSETFTRILGIIYTGYEKGQGYFATVLPLLSFGIFILLLVAFPQKKRDNLFFLLLMWGVLLPVFIALISLFKPIFFPRYVIFSTPGLLLLIIYVVDRLPYAAKAIILASLFFVTIYYQNLQVQKRNKANFSKALGEVRALVKEGDVVYVTSELDFFIAQYYFARDKSIAGFDEKQVYVYGKNYDEIPEFVGKALIPKDRIAISLPYYPKKAFILKNNRDYDIQTLY